MYITDFIKSLQDQNLSSKPQLVSFCGNTYKTYSKIDMIAKVIEQELNNGCVQVKIK